MQIKTIRLDEVDLKILTFLQRDAKLTAKVMAEQLNLTSTPIYERIKKLEQEGVIVGYSAKLDPNKLERSMLVYLNITIKDHAQKVRQKFIASVKKMPEVMEFCLTSGSFDFLIKVRFRDIQEYRDFLVNRLSPIDNINDIESHIVLEEIKSTTEIDLSDL